MDDRELRKTFAAYQARMKKIYDEQSMIGEAEMRGEEKGIEKGIEKGKEEGAILEKQNIAKKLIDGKMPLEDVVKFTGLSLEEVQSIQQGMQ